LLAPEASAASMRNETLHTGFDLRNCFLRLIIHGLKFKVNIDGTKIPQMIEKFQAKLLCENYLAIF
jgi:hypothetical protein